MTSKQVPRRKTVRSDDKLLLQAVSLAFARTSAEKNAKRRTRCKRSCMSVRARARDISRLQSHSQAHLFYVLLQRLLSKGVISRMQSKA